MLQAKSWRCTGVSVWVTVSILTPDFHKIIQLNAALTFNPIDKPTQGNFEWKRGNDAHSTQLYGYNSVDMC